MNKEYKDYLNSKEWYAIKVSLFNIRGKKCERCGNEKQLQIHHRHYRNIFNEKPEDLQIVCAGCHGHIHKLWNKKKKKPDVKKMTKKDRYKYFNDKKLRKKNREYLALIRYEKKIGLIRDCSEMRNTLFGGE